jgi:hypothetical protein
LMLSVFLPHEEERFVHIFKTLDGIKGLLWVIFWNKMETRIKSNLCIVYV